MNNVKRLAASVILAGALAAPVIPALGSSASAAPPLFQGGLVNVAIGNVALLNNVGVGVAANLCDINAAVLVADIRDDGSATCNSTATGFRDGTVTLSN